MREFARATVLQIEQFFKLPRAQWGADTAALEDGASVRFFLESPDGVSTEFLYHAMVDLAGSLGEPILFGSPDEVPVEWLDAEKIQFYFGASLEEFKSPGFLERYFQKDR